jgi:hypothetical protein
MLYRAGLSFKTLASVNYSVNLGFKIALAVTVVKFLWDLWQAIVSSRASQRLCHGILGRWKLSVGVLEDCRRSFEGLLFCLVEMKLDDRLDSAASDDAGCA